MAVGKLPGHTEKVTNLHPLSLPLIKTQSAAPGGQPVRGSVGLQEKGTGSSLCSCISTDLGYWRRPGGCRHQSAR